MQLCTKKLKSNLILLSTLQSTAKIYLELQDHFYSKLIYIMAYYRYLISTPCSRTTLFLLDLLTNFVTQPCGADVRAQQRHWSLVLEIGQIQRSPVLHESRYRGVIFRYDSPMQCRITVQVVSQRVRRTQSHQQSRWI